MRPPPLPALGCRRSVAGGLLLLLLGRVLRLLRLLLLVGLATRADAFSSLCRSSYADPGAFDTKVQCNDAASNWPAEHQFCLPDNWGLQCGACLQTCYFVETQGGQAFLPFQYTLPSVGLFAQTCDVRAAGAKYQNESSLGNYCCKPCKLWRLVTERCGQLIVDAEGVNQSCHLEDAEAQEGLPLLRCQSSLDNTEAAPHWLFIPPTPNRGIEDSRTNVSFFQQAYRLALDPAKYLKPLRTGQRKHQEQPFDASLIPGRMGPTNVALGLNQANQRSQHQAHVHYAALPTSFRNHILRQARVPPAADPATAPCTPASGLRFGDHNVSYFAWFFPWDLGSPPGPQQAQAQAQAWDLRSLALKQCPPLVETFVRGPDGQLMATPPPLPFAPGAADGGGALPLPDPRDFLMSQVAIIITPGFSLDPATGRPFGHYVILGSTGSRFHAETLICTEWGIKVGWDAATDCPPTREGWPQPEPGPPTATATATAALAAARMAVVDAATGELEMEEPAGAVGTTAWLSPSSRLRRPPVVGEGSEALAAFLLLERSLQ